MLREAELFVMAEQMLVEVLGRIRDGDRDIVLPPLFDAPGADQAAPLWRVVEQYAYDDTWVPDLLAGRTMDEVGRHRFDGDLLGDDPNARIARIADAASAAARGITAPLPLPENVSWRDRFLLSAGHEPHPLGH